MADNQITDAECNELMLLSAKWLWMNAPHEMQRTALEFQVTLLSRESRLQLAIIVQGDVTVIIYVKAGTRTGVDSAIWP